MIRPGAPDLPAPSCALQGWSSGVSAQRPRIGLAVARRTLAFGATALGRTERVGAITGEHDVSACVIHADHGQSLDLMPAT
jgi:hypothetical protein